MRINAGDTAWVLISAALVMFMTPGLALFYGGMVRAKNVLSMLMQNFVCLGIVGVLWAVCIYSLAFSGTGKFGIGTFDDTDDFAEVKLWGNKAKPALNEGIDSPGISSKAPPK